jgi:hypothetical protein
MNKTGKESLNGLRLLHRQPILFLDSKKETWGRQMQNDLQNVNKRTGETPKEIETRKSPQAKRQSGKTTHQPTIPKKKNPMKGSE